MNDYPVLLSVALLASGCAAIACALYAARGEYDRPVIRLLLAMCCTLLVWSVGLAVMVSASNEAIGQIGAAVAPVGYCLMFSLMLHYALVLTRGAEALKKWWVHALIYAPGLACLYGFTLYPMLYGLRYALVETPLGWANASMNGWVRFFYGYYAAFTLATVLLLWRWGRASSDPGVRKQAKWLMATLAAATALGTATDVVPALAGVRLPSMAAVFSLLPIYAISHSVSRYGLMRPAEPDPNVVILDNPTRASIHLLLGRLFIAGSALNLLAQTLFYHEEGLSNIYGFSAFLLLAGVALTLLNRLKLEEDFKELLLAFACCLMIPAITLRFWVYGTVTIWTVYFAMLVASLLFNRRIILVAVLLSAFVAQLVSWAVMPEADVGMDTADHMVRLVLILMTSVLCVFVNRVYRARLRENAKRIASQTLISEITHSFVSATEENFDAKVLWMLGQCGLLLQCDRGYLALLDRETKRIAYSCEWVAKGIPSCREQFESRIWGASPALAERLQGGGMLELSEGQPLPAGDESLREQLMLAGVRGTVVFPIRHGGKVLGFMSFNAGLPVAEWNADSPSFLTVVANTIGESVAKIDDVKRIQFIAYHDQLTALPNRLLFRDRLNQAIALAQRAGTMVGVVFLDLDSFKTVNDTMGHELGDRLLVEMARSIARHLRRYDTVARYGGDEFVLLLDQIESTPDLLGVLDNLMQTIQAPIDIEGQEFFMTGSVGVAVYPQDGPDAETLIKHADLAMYQAKALGKNRYALCSVDMKDKALEQMRLTNLLYRALERQELAVYYQPQVDLQTHAVVGMEALLRWMPQGRGMVSPAVFIPLAEQTGLINPIGAWVLMTACQQVKRWQDMGLPAIRIAVNISLHQLTNKQFPHHVAEVLEKTGLGAEYLELEVTESVANNQVTDVVEILSELKALGISLSIDDFGTEYSSLSRLKQLPADRLKLDMQFVRGIEHNEKDRAITKVIINLAKSLHMKVIAEGVETAPQLDFLSRKLCDEVQGYYFYKPMPAQDMENVLRAGCVPEVPVLAAAAADGGPVPR